MRTLNLALDVAWEPEPVLGMPPLVLAGAVVAVALVAAIAIVRSARRKKRDEADGAASAATGKAAGRKPAPKHMAPKK